MFPRDRAQRGGDDNTAAAAGADFWAATGATEADENQCGCKAC